MRILIEEYQYAYEDVNDVLDGLGVLQDINGKVSINYVGYYFNPNPDVNDCVFILPKVLLEGRFGHEKVFGHIDPRELIHAEKCTSLTKEEYTFIYNLSVWIYRAISVFKEHEYDRQGGARQTPSIVLHKQASIMGHSKRRKSATFLDVLLALQQWAKDNESFVMYVVKNIHSGYNKINWNRTIAKSPVLLQDYGVARSELVYLNPINKKRQINFDEELLVIFFSIIRHIKDTYGFPTKTDLNFPLIIGKKFERYLNGFGKVRLKQIKYKYYSDKSLELWDLCYAFFEHPYKVNINACQKEYLLVKSFHILFESIIDELIAGDQKMPKELLDQPDGKIVDHMYQYRELTNDDNGENIYYIGDSKYYKRGNALGKESVYKQFTYARNVIQWNIDLFNDDNRKEEQKSHIKLRDDITEGYNVIPNFFISANQNVLRPEDDIKLIDSDKKEGEKKRQQYYISRQFENRLFDRDTFLLAHYDVNFLFVVALYGRNNQSSKVLWRDKVRRMFRHEIQQMLKENFIFYAITAREDIDPESYIRQNFQSLLGKIFQPFNERIENSQKYYSIALRNPEKEKDIATRERIFDENETIISQVKQSFYVALCPLGTDPKSLPEDVLPIVYPKPRIEIPRRLLTKHYLENYLDTSFVIGAYNGWKQLNWIFSRLGGKRDDAYNVRLGKSVHGGVVKSRDSIKHAKFVLLYEFGKENEGIRYAFRVKNTGILTKEQMLKTGYDHPKHDFYFCYFFDEEISLGEFNVSNIIKFDRLRFEHEIGVSQKDIYPIGRPIYILGSELIEFRKTTDV